MDNLMPPDSLPDSSPGGIEVRTINPGVQGGAGVAGFIGDPRPDHSLGVIEVLGLTQFQFLRNLRILKKF